MVATTELLPTKETSGLKVVWLVLPLLVVVNTPAEGTVPFTVQLKVTGSDSASLAFAVKPYEFGKATVLPVALGVCEAHVGGVFLLIVQVRVAVLVPLDNVATNVFAPEVRDDESTF